MGKIDCQKCGKKFEENGYSSLCSDCRRKKASTRYTYIGIIVILVGIFLGIISGSVFKAISLTDLTYKFNTMLMFLIIASSFALGIIIIGIGSICKKVDMLIEKTK